MSAALYLLAAGSWSASELGGPSLYTWQQLFFVLGTSACLMLICVVVLTLLLWSYGLAVHVAQGIVSLHTHHKRKRRLPVLLVVYHSVFGMAEWRAASKGKAAGVRRRTLHRAALVSCFYVLLCMRSSGTMSCLRQFCRGHLSDGFVSMSQCINRQMCRLH
jgi:hypothetical protein